MEFLKRASLVYLATPYTRYPKGLRQSFEDSCRLAGRLMTEGVVLFCPVAHSHPIAIFGRIDPTAHSFWLRQDESMMQAAQILLVGKLDGWNKSEGIAIEITTFKELKKRVYYIDPQSLEISAEP